MWDYTPYILDLKIKDPEYFSNKTNDPFYYLGAFEPIPGYEPRKLGQPHYGVINDPTYCTQTDLYNLLNPSNMFEMMNFYTDYPHDGTSSLINLNGVGMYRAEVMPSIGNDMMKDTSISMSKSLYKSVWYKLWSTNLQENFSFKTRNHFISYESFWLSSIS